MQNLAEQWYAPGKFDRQERFMIATGGPEFSNLVWPLVTYADDQVHQHALRAAKQFLPH